MSGLLVVISGPGGVGKDTLIERLRAADPRLVYAVSYTTRPRRAYEVDGQHYCFVDEAHFWRLDVDGELMEHARINGHLYGTSNSRVERSRAGGFDVILKIDVQGAEQIRQRVPDAVAIFVSPPSMEELWRRRQHRGSEPLDVIEARQRLAENEMAQADRYDHVVVNDDPDRAAVEILAIVEQERRRARATGDPPPPAFAGYSPDSPTPWSRLRGDPGAGEGSRAVSPVEMADVPPAVHGLRVAVLVSGGIAAYKVADLVSRLAQADCQVRVAMTPAATRFVGPITFQGLSGHPVQTDLFAPGGHPEPHVELGDWAHVALVAPATADVLARLNAGRANDMVTATVLAARCPVVVAPAMNDAMWAKPAVIANVERLRERGVTVVDPESGHLASGHVGAGRLPGPAALLAAMARACSRQDLAGRRVVVTAGGTREPIDPVRFVSNYSSGKMGHAIAAAAAERGAHVTLVTTVSHLPEHPYVRSRQVETAEAMGTALAEELPGSHLLVMAAAVADFRPAHRVEHKIRREQTSALVLELAPIPDLVAELGHLRGVEHTFRLGFAAEDSELTARAHEKLERKGLDAIFANDVSRSDIGFGVDDNAGMLLMRDGTRLPYERMSKRELADRLLDAVAPRLK